jgi:hypothetical protein
MPMTRRTAFLAGYQYGWESDHAWYGNCGTQKESDDWVDAGILAAHQDKAEKKAYDPEAAFARYEEENPLVSAATA